MYLFFDIDGTLLDQRRAEQEAAVQFLDTYGDLLPEPCTVEQFCSRWRSLREKHLPAWLNRTIPYREYQRRRIRDLFGGDQELPNAAAEERYDFFRQAYRRAWKLYDDTPVMLEDLADRPLGIISNGNSRHQRLKLSDTRILPHFSVVAISDRIGAAKPHPEIFRAACRLAGAQPSESVYVGDQLESDIRPAIDAGMRGIWINRNGAATVPGVEQIRSLAELHPLLGNALNGTEHRPRRIPATRHSVRHEV